MHHRTTKAFRGGRLLSIDALRGLAALGVVFYHAIQQTKEPIPQGTLKWPALLIQFLSSYGYIGVFLFFVISGFCIHLQWVRSRAGRGTPDVQFAAFWKRRIRRLYPPYLIAFGVYLLIAAITTGITVSRSFFYDVGMHVLMLHNLDPQTCYSINGVFWTLAVEEQLYLAYFLLLFLRTRWGWGVTLVVCLLSRVLWYAFAKVLLGFTGFAIPVAEGAAVHWFTWALGAIAVEAFFGQLRLPTWCRKLWLGAGLVILGGTMAVYLPSLHNLLLHDSVWLLLHPVWGLGFFVIVNAAVFAEDGWLRRLTMPRLVQIFGWVGIFSYSLYLTHELVVMQSWRFGSWHRFPMANTILLVVPAALAAAWLFFRFCERPYMRMASRTQKPIEREEVFGVAIEQAEA